MANINLTDRFGLDIKFSPGPFAVFSKYLREFTQVNVSLNDGKDIRADTIGGYPFQLQSLGLCFQQPVGLGASGVELTIKPEVSGSLAVQRGRDLLDSVLYDLPNSQSLLGQTYLSAALEASLAGDLKDQSGLLQFGLNAGSSAVLSYSQPVQPTDKLVPAIKEVFESFCVPGELEDLRGMPVGSIASVEGCGNLTLSAAVDLLTVVNPLATVATAAVPLAKISLQEGGSLSVVGALSFTGEYKIQASKLDADRVLLGYSSCWDTRGCAAKSST